MRPRLMHRPCGTVWVPRQRRDKGLKKPGERAGRIRQKVPGQPTHCPGCRWRLDYESDLKTGELRIL